MLLETFITHKGVKYPAQLARVKRTKLGYEDHGILSVSLEFEGLNGSWGQGMGAFFADKPEKMFPWVRSLIDFFGGDWESIVGKEVFLFLGEDRRIAGLAQRSGNDVLLVEEVLQEIRKLEGLGNDS